MTNNRDFVINVQNHVTYNMSKDIPRLRFVLTNYESIIYLPILYLC